MIFEPNNSTISEDPRGALLAGPDKLIDWRNDASQNGSAGMRSAFRSGAGVNVAPGSQDDGWLEPSPVCLDDGTSVELYKDGQALHAAYHAIESARRTICLEVYIFHSDRTGRTFAELLARRAMEGLEVRVIYDSIGSALTDPGMFRRMHMAGVRVHEFHPWQPWHAKHSWRLWHRDHRKLLVVDDEVGILGGQNLGNEYGSSWVVKESDSEGWRDTAIGVRGAAVRLLSASFDLIWHYTDEGGPLRAAEFFHSTSTYRHDRAGSLLPNQPAHRHRDPKRLGPESSKLDIPENSMAVLASAPTPRSPMLSELQRLLRDASLSIELTMAYFAPPEEFLEQLCRSAREGVRVRLMLPNRSDVPILVVAARSFYEKLLEAGAEIYERLHGVLHAKTLCVDERISIVGSTNLDYQSIQRDYELSAVIHSAQFGSQMHDLFEHDVSFAHRIDPDEWRHRPGRDRIVQWVAMKARYVL